MERKILTAQQQALLQRAKQLLQHMRDFLSNLDNHHEQNTLLTQLAASLDELFMIVVVGEFNAGKSTLINALLGEDVLEEGAVETTSKITQVRYGKERRQSYQVDRNLVMLYHPASFLQEMSLVDTPGTNTVWHEQIRLTEDFIPRSDLILFLMRAHQPFTNSERQFLEFISTWGKKVVLVLNMIDTVSPEALPTIIGSIQEKARRLLGFQPEILPISTLRARQARKADGEAAQHLLESSGFTALEQFLFTTLDQGERVRLKLLAPLGVAQKLITDAQTTVAQRDALLAEDERGIAAIEVYLKQWLEDMKANTISRVGNIEKIVLEMGQRGLVFIDQNIQVLRIFYLAKRDQVLNDFKSKVIGQSESAIEEQIRDLVDWQIRQQQQSWQHIVEYADQRLKVNASASQDQLIGSVATRFDDNRRALLLDLLDTSKHVLNNFETGFDAMVQRFAQDVQSAVKTAVALGASGVVLGTVSALIGVAVGSLVVDVTGILAGLIVLATGVFVIPVQHRRAKRKFQAGIASICQALQRALDEAVQREQQGVTERIRDTIKPYTFFVKKQQEFMHMLKQQLATLHDEIKALKTSIETEV